MFPNLVTTATWERLGPLFMLFVVVVVVVIVREAGDVTRRGGVSRPFVRGQAPKQTLERSHQRHA